MKKISVKKKVPNCEKNISKMYEKIKEKNNKTTEKLKIYIIWGRGGYEGWNNLVYNCIAGLSVYIIYLSNIFLEIMCCNYITKQTLLFLTTNNAPKLLKFQQAAKERV